MPTKKARTLKSIDPAHAKRIDDKRKHMSQLKALADKTFEELSSEDKDALLKTVAVKLGLIKAD